MRTDILDQRYFCTRLRRFSDFQVVHESAHQEQSAAGMPQQVRIVQRVRHLLHLEPLALIGDSDRETSALPNLVYGTSLASQRFSTETADMNLLVAVVPVSMDHRIHHAFPHSHAYPVLLVFIETNLFRGFQDLALGQVDALQRRRVMVVEDFFHARIQSHISTEAQRGRDPFCACS